MEHQSFILPPGPPSPALLAKLRAWDGPSTLALVFGAPEHRPPSDALSAALPTSILIGASSDGTLLGGTVPPRDCFTLTLMKFRESRFVLAGAEEGEEGLLGGVLSDQLGEEPLNGIFLMAAGGHALGNLLIRALNTHSKAPITGGLAATHGQEDGWIMVGARIIRRGALALGYLGKASFQSAVAMGWDQDESVQGLRTSGVKRNGVKLLNGLPAIKAIAKALGLGPQQLSSLKEGTLSFPFAIGMHGKSLVLNDFNEKTGEALFSGDMDHSGQHLSLLKAHPAKLVRATSQAAESVCKGAPPGVVLFLVCNARRQALGRRHQTELGAVSIHMHPDSALVGWYSWGEVAKDELGSRVQNLRGVVLNITEPLGDS